MRLKTLCLAALILAAVCVTPASALEYTMDAPDDYLFARPTSDTTIYEHEDPNVDRSKNTALIPPGFGTPTSYLPGSGTALTPNLVPGALDGGGLVSQVGSVTYPAVDTGSGWTGTTATGWTDVTSDLYYSGGHLGTLKIPAIGLSVKVYEGTDSKTLSRAGTICLWNPCWIGRQKRMEGPMPGKWRCSASLSGTFKRKRPCWPSPIPGPAISNSSTRP